MRNSLIWLGRSAGAIGFILCLASGLARLVGRHWLGDFEAATVLLIGIGGMVLGCFCLLQVLIQDAGKSLRT